MSQSNPMSVLSLGMRFDGYSQSATAEIRSRRKDTKKSCFR